ncbi:MAG: endonuclease domain-containing protein [Paludibacteraceae bacterium]|nr:endonuclease domain-containing protein [Paludibacteraceae bacterium]
MFVLDRRINNLRDTLNLRRRLRKNMTPAEVALWTMIRKRQVGNYRFQRQFGIGPYVADFYCDEAKLVIELDGEAHNDQAQMEHDRIRTEYMEALGIEVLRFENFEVFDYAQRTLDTIKQKIEERLNILEQH